jgi:hypothetical protein
LYLKAAWADPVLYGGEGRRTGSDIDVLVRPRTFFTFAAALEREGFHRYVAPWMRASFRWGYKAWTYEGLPRWMTVDLHRAIADAPWFDLPADDCIDRAMAYDSVDGPVLSLSPEDQLLYAAAHYGNHRFSIDQRHLDDVELLVKARPVDWAAVVARARPLGLAVPLALVQESLRARGAAVPAPEDVPSLRWRLAYAHRWVTTSPELARSQPWSRVLDNAVRMPLLSGRAAAMPRFVAGYLGLRALDVAAEIAARVTGRDPAQR